MRRPFLLIALTLLVALAGIGGQGIGVAAQEGTPTAVDAAMGALERTDVRYLLPYTPDGLNPALTVSGEESGTCDSPSVAAADRPDAWRCFSTGALDPCFENPFGAVEPPIELACMSDPWSTEVVLFTTTAPLPREKEMVDPAADATPPPWALELANGEQCGILTGATAIYAGMRINYGCVGQGYVIGEPSRQGPVWVVSYLPDGGLATELVAVTVAWT
jgi:hypothetical protein